MKGTRLFACLHRNYDGRAEANLTAVSGLQHETRHYPDDDVNSYELPTNADSSSFSE